MAVVIVLLILGWYVTYYQNPLVLSSSYAGLILVLDIFFNTSIIESILSAVIALIFSFSYLWLLLRYIGTVFMWYAIFVGGAILWAALPFILS